MLKNALIFGAALLVGAAVSLPAAKLGDPAEPLTIKDWVKGKAVDVKDGKHLYVVEFWATWCGPCRTSIPHLTELQKKFKDKGVVFVGISDEEIDKVKPFVEKMGEKMDYVVACDNERKTFNGYMEAYGQGGIPTAFIVGKDGKVLWFGHPMAELEDTVQAVLDGKFDLSDAVKRDEDRALKDDYQKLSVAGDPKAKELGRKLLEAAGDDVEELTGLAFSIAANARNMNRDFALAHEALEKAEKIAGKNDTKVLGIRSIALFESGKESEGLALAKKAVELAKDDKERANYERYVRVMEARIKSKAGAGDKKAE